MTVGSSTNRSGPYAGNGATVTFAFAIQTLAAADIKVVSTTLVNGANVDTTLTLTTDYSVSLNADQSASPGGSVTMVVAPATGVSITILRSIGSTQGAAFPNQGGFYPKVLEAALDKLTMLYQQISEELARALKISVTQPTSDLPATLLSIATAETNTAASATSAASSATAAAGSSSAASTSATAASGSASAASTSATAAAGSASAASTSATSAASSASAASTSATAAASSATAASGSASAASTSATNAATSASAAASSASAASTSATAASGSASAASTSATSASTSATSSSDWATKTTGQVAATDYSAKAYAIGGTGVTSSIGAAKEWATTTGAAVITGTYSAKEWAVGTFTRGAASGGSSKDWATYTAGTTDNADYSAKAYAVGGTGVTSSIGAAKEWASTTGVAVITGSYSAKEWAVGTFTRGAASGGSSKDWATYTAGTADNADYSAKEWAVGVQTRGVASKGSAKDWATYTGGAVDGTGFSAKYWAQQSQAAAGLPIADGQDLFKNAIDNTKILRFDLSSIATGTTRTLTVPNASGTVALQGAITTSGMTQSTGKLLGRTTAATGAIEEIAVGGNLTLSAGILSSTGTKLLATLTPTAAAAVNALNVFSSSYDTYLIVGEGIAPSANDTLTMQLAVSGALDTASTYYNSPAAGTGMGGAFTTATTKFNVTASSVATAGNGTNFEILLQNMNDATNFKSFHTRGVREDVSTPSFREDVQAGAYTGANAITGVGLFWNAASNFKAQGKIYIYGNPNS